MNLPVRQNPWMSRRNPIFSIIFIIILLWLMTGCFGGGGDNADGAVEGQPVQKTLQCSEPCANNGQCGRAADGRLVVLARTDQPNTQNHDRLFPVDEPVEILLIEQRTIQRPGSELAQQPFSFVNLVSEQKTGWVADWCIAEP